MKYNMKRWMIAAAAVTIAAGSAAAQTFTAEVPLAFRIGNKLMPPGSYSINIPDMSGTHAVVVRNSTYLNQSALLMAAPTGKVLPAWKKAGTPLLAFECGDGGCVLRSLWNGDAFAYRFSGAKPTGDLRMAYVALTPAKAD